MNKPYKALFDELCKSSYDVTGVLGYDLNPQKVNVVLRIDVDSREGWTSQIARELGKRGLKATFFFRRPTWYARRISRRGHEVGYHHAGQSEEEMMLSIKGLGAKVMTAHGGPHRGMREIRAIYEDVDPATFGLTMHDGSPDYPWGCLQLSDYMRMHGAWRYYPAYPLREIRCLLPGQTAHICMHPFNMFGRRRWVWRQFLRMRMIFQVRPMVTRLVFRALGAVLGPPKIVKCDDPSELIYNKGINFWYDKLEKFGLTDLRFRSALEVGAGNGQWLVAMSHHYPFIVGVEPDFWMMRNCKYYTRQRFKLGHNIRLVVAKAERLPFKAAAFNTVLCYGVLMYTDERKAMGEMARVMNRQFDTVVVAVDGLGYFLMKLVEAIRTKDEQQFHYSVSTIIKKFTGMKGSKFFTMRRMRGLFHDNGLSVDSVSPESGIGEYPYRYLGFPVFFRVQGSWKDWEL